MKFYHLKKSGFACLSVLLLAFFGCSKESGPPAPLSIEQLPAAMDKAFSNAKGETKDLATQIVVAVQAQDYAKAFLTLQTLTEKPDLNKEQGSVASRAMLTLNELLKSAVSKGDAPAPAAAAALRQYQMTK